MKSRTISPENKLRVERLSIYLRELRLNQGITQEELSRIANVHRNTIIRAEKIEERGHISLISIFELADALDIEVQDLFSICSEK